jgi:hypothetical protein
LLTVVSGLIRSLTNFGLGKSAFKNVPVSNALDYMETVSTIVTQYQSLLLSRYNNNYMDEIISSD